MKIIFSLLFVFINLSAFSTKDLIELYENNFKEDKLLQVKEIDNYYFIVSSSIPFSDRKDTNKLELLSKFLLFKYLKEKDKKIESLELTKFKTALSWQKSSKKYLFSFIKKDNVKSIYLKNKDTTLQLTLDNEIKTLEDFKDKNITIYEQLKELYYQNADMDNYNKQMDSIMKVKFNEL
jgi:hypothetical protein